ncbi:MAG: hypothetical protein HC856_07770 [Pseudanabaena sp. RU_4_16]|nr:hypothetical protein [Pseudanabaena sp. RU_4_16]
MSRNIMPSQTSQSSSSLDRRKPSELDLPYDTQQPVTMKAELVSQQAKWSASLQTVLDQPPASFPGQIMLGGLVFVPGIWSLG